MTKLSWKTKLRTLIVASSIILISLVMSCGHTVTPAATPIPFATKSSKPTATIAPTSTPDLVFEAQQAALLYSQDFESGQTDGLYSYTPTEDWSISIDENGNHVYCNKYSPAFWTTVQVGLNLWTNYAVELKFKFMPPRPNGTVEVFGRMDKYSNGYGGFLDYPNQGAGLVSNHPGTQMMKAISAYPSFANQWYSLRLELAGGKIKFFINNVLFSQMSNTDYTHGKAAFGVSPSSLVCVDDIRVWALTQDGQIAQLSPPAISAPRSLAERLASHKFPKLFNLHQDYDPTSDFLAQAYYWDLLIFPSEVAKSEWGVLGPKGLIRSENPNSVILAIYSAQEYYPDDSSKTGRPFVSALKPEWTMRDIYGKPYHIFYYGDSSSWSLMINLSTEVSTFIPQYVNDTSMKTGLFDGVFYDGIGEDWSGLVNRSDNPPNGPIDINNDGKADTAAQVNAAMDAGTINLLNETRKMFPAGSIITGNSGDGSLLLGRDATQDTVYAELLNGRQIEGFLSGHVSSLDWLKNMRNYYLMQQASLEPKIPLVMAFCNGNDYGNLRYALASALMFDGYFTCTNYVPQNRAPWYTATWWYDEYSVDLATGKAVKSLDAKGYLGLPVSDAYNAANKDELLGTLLSKNDPGAKQLVWRRDFQNGIVLVNPSGMTRIVDLNGTFRKILGVQDPLFNDGTKVTKVSLPFRSGIILLSIP